MFFNTLILKIIQRTAGLLITAFLLHACSNTALREHTIQGSTMGTQFTIKVLLPANSPLIKHLSNDVNQRLEKLNQSLSNWQSDSELSRFNAYTSTQWQPLSEDLYNVMQEANIIHQQSQGKFDVTLSPLIDLWGFGPIKHTAYPSPSRIQSALKNVGQARLIQLKDTPPSMKKQQADVQINLSALAKGYAIDQLAEYLISLEIDNFLVEIGGDLRTRGVNIKGQRWRVGIEKPNDLGHSIQSIIALDNQSIATSGDYRNFFVNASGQRMSHIIDPTTGYPITHKLSSVTVINQTAMRADALATALLVLGEKEGLALANKHNIAALFIRRDANSRYSTSLSQTFKSLYPEQ